MDILKITNGKESIVMCKMPNRKKVCLAVETGNTLTEYATFKDNEAAYEFMLILSAFVGAKVDRECE